MNERIVSFPAWIAFWCPVSLSCVQVVARMTASGSSMDGGDVEGQLYVSRTSYLRLHTHLGPPLTTIATLSSRQRLT